MLPTFGVPKLKMKLAVPQTPTLILPKKVGSIRVGIWGTKTLMFSLGTPKVGSIMVGIWGTKTSIFSFGAQKVGSIRIGIWATES